MSYESQEKRKCWEQLDKAEEERDEARALARALFQNLRRISLGADPGGDRLEQEYPWLRIGGWPKQS